MIRKTTKNQQAMQNDYHRPHDTWTTQPLADGSGYRRVRSLRSQRTIFTLAVTAFTVGALIIIGSSPYNNEFLAPGAMCSAHAQILAGQGADRCAACHGAADRTVAAWLADTLTGGRSIGPSQSELCLKCHEKSIVPDFALNPHGIAPLKLTELTDKVHHLASFKSGRPFLQSLAQPPLRSTKNSHDQIACSACHREHHGATSLTALTDQQCQSCHSQVYHRFETDHPEFSNWPQQRRSRIAFDHSTHSGKHFPGKSTEFNCSVCHVDGPSKNVKQLASFEQSCAACHERQILQSAESGLAILALPSVDTDAIERAKLNIGTWPLAATGDFDGKIPPAMKLLLHADPNAANALLRFEETFGANFEFSDIDADDGAQVADAVELVWATKRLLNEMALSGRAAIVGRLRRVLGADVSSEQVARLAAELDESVFQNTVRRWLPGLAAEVANHRFDGVARPTRLIGLSGAGVRSTSRMVPVTFTRPVQDEDALVANQLAEGPGGESTLEEPAATDSSRPVRTLESFDSPEALANEKTDGPAAARPRRVTLRNRVADDMVNDDELLAVNPLASMGAGLPAFELPVTKFGDGQSSSASSKQDPADTANATAAIEPPPITRVGWYRDDELFRVFYRPGGHEDDGIRAWSDLVAAAKEANERPETASLFQQLLSDNGVGLCATCHTVDQRADQSFEVNWIARYRNPAARPFTKFSHQPHTLQPHLRDCSGCHDMAQPIGNKESFVGFDPSEFVSNFAAITKLNCVNCHREGATDNSCTHCHSYHVGHGSGDTPSDN